MVEDESDDADRGLGAGKYGRIGEAPLIQGLEMTEEDQREGEESALDQVDSEDSDEESAHSDEDSGEWLDVGKYFVDHWSWSEYTGAALDTIQESFEEDVRSVDSMTPVAQTNEAFQSLKLAGSSI